MIITREKGMRMWGGGSGSTSASGVNGGGGFSLAVEEGEGTGNAYTGFTYESGVLSLIKGEKFVTVDFFNRLFTAYDSDGNAILPNDVTSTINNLKLLVGTWTEEYLSALGKNSEGGGGGGGIELSDVWQSLKTNTDDYANQKINSAHIPDLSGTYATKTWVNQQGFVTSSGVTSVAMTVPTGLSVSGSPITSTGTLALTFTSGYSIPTTAKQSNWDTAYGWGNHATAGYATASSVTTLQGYFTNGVAKTAAKLNTGTTTYTAWGQTYWSSGVPQSISGNMTSVGSITPSANGNALGTTSARFAIYGTSGNYSSTLTVADAITLSGSTAAKKRIYFGDTSHYIELDSTGFHFSHGVYSDSFVSALGANSSGGGGGTFDEEAMWEALGTTSTAKVIASSHIPNLDASKITSGTFAAARIPIATASAVGGIKVGTTLAISSGVLNQKSGIATAGTYRSVTVDTYGRVTAGTNPTTLAGYGITDAKIASGTITLGSNTITPLTSSSSLAWGKLTGTPTTLSGYGITNAYTKTQVDNALGGYLPLSGGTLTGTLTAPKIRINTRHSSDDTRGGIYYYNGTTDYLLIGQGSANLWIGANETDGTHHTGGTFISAGSGDAAISRLVNGSRENYIILDAGNYSSYALPLTGGTLTGGLTALGYDIKFDTDSSREIGLAWLNTSDTKVASVTYHNTYKNIIINPVGSSNTWSDAVGKYSLFIGNNKLTYNTYPILHSNNYSSYALPLSGGTLTGSLFVSSDLRVVSTTSGHLSVGSNLATYNVSRAEVDVVTPTDNPSEIWLGVNATRVWSLTCRSTSEGSYFGIYNAGWRLTLTGSNLWVAGEITAASDARKKNIISNTKFNVKDIASARSIIYEWNDDRDKDNEKKIHGGSIAQDWLGKADDFITKDDDGYMSLNYGALALCSAITIAREVVKHDDEITRLKKEVVKLRERVAELEERRA